MKNQIKGFSQFINENKSETKTKAKKKATIYFEFDWTWADQMPKGDARVILYNELESNGFSNGVESVGEIVLDGWSNRKGAPKYNRPYTAEIPVYYSGTIAGVRTWANQIQLGEVVDIETE